MKMTSKLLVVTLAGYSCSLVAQPALVGSSYTLATEFNVAPGQLVTLLVEGLSSSISQTIRAPAGPDLPPSLAGITGGYSQTLGPGGPATPFLEVHPYWGRPDRVLHDGFTPLAAITVQIPFEAQCDRCAPLGGIPQAVMGFLEARSTGRWSTFIPSPTRCTS